MKKLTPFTSLVLMFIIFIFIISFILPFCGVDYTKRTISSLGFFLETPIMHDLFAIVLFWGCPALILTWGIIFTRKTLYIKACVCFVALLPFVFWGITLRSIFEWFAFWGTALWIIFLLFFEEEPMI